MWRGGIVARIMPEYPEEAIRRHLQDEISVRVLINRDGKVEQACGNGNPALRDAAERAALQWIFRTPELNGEKVPYVQATLYFNFVLNPPEATVLRKTT
jgi:TonB family protein